MRYIVRRLLRALLILVGVSTVCFLFTEFAPGNFFDEMRLNPRISPDTITQLQERYGLNQPLPVRYGRWLRAVAHGNFGFSLAYNAPVAPLLWDRAKNTLLLTCTATLFTWLIGLAVGVWTASTRARLPDRLMGVATSFLISIPEIVLAIVLLALAVRTRIVPLGGMVSLGYEELSGRARFLDLSIHILLPALILVLGSIAIVERHVRASVLEVLDAPCIHAARGLGIGNARLLFRHVLPLAANPAISLFGFSLAGLLGGSLLVEVVTGWPGLGPLVLEATLSHDIHVVIAAVMFSAFFMIGGNFIADLLLLVFDPRIRAGEADAS